MASAKDVSGNPSTGGDGSGVWALLPRDGAGMLTPAPISSGFRQRPEILSAKPTAAGMWHAMRRRMGLALGLGLLTGLLIAALVWLFVPVRYEATAIVRIASTTTPVIGSGPSIDYENYKRSQAVAITNPKVLYAALQRPEISELPLIKRQADPASWLHDKLLLDFPQNGEFLRVSLRGDEPSQLAPIVNAVVAAYMEEVVDKENAKLRERRDLLEKKVQEYQDARETEKRTDPKHRRFGADQRQRDGPQQCPPGANELGGDGAKVPRSGGADFPSRSRYQGRRVSGQEHAAVCPTTSSTWRSPKIRGSSSWKRTSPPSKRNCRTCET